MDSVGESFEGAGSVPAASALRAVVHLATVSDVAESVRAPRRAAAVNVGGTVNVLGRCAAHGVRRFVFASTGGALYGDSAPLPTPEDWPPSPLSPYGASKAAAEARVAAMARGVGMGYAILRYGNVYGPRTGPGRSAGVVPAFCRAVFSVRSSRFGAFEFAVRSDALVTNTESAASENLIGAAGAASRVRLMLEGSGSMPLGSSGMLQPTLEGSGSMPLGSSGMLQPTLEAGLRYDGGDAETGAGLEIGGGLGYAAGALAVEVRARMLLAHQDTEYEEWGFSGSIRW